MEVTAHDEDEVFCRILAVFFKDQGEILVLCFIRLCSVCVSIYLSAMYFKCLFSLYLCISCVSFVSVNGTDFPATFSPTWDCLFLPFEAGLLMLHLCTLPCSTVGVLPFLFLPPTF